MSINKPVWTPCGEDVRGKMHGLQNVKTIQITEVDSMKYIFLLNRDPIGACDDHIKATARGGEARQLSPLAVRPASVISRALPSCFRSLHQGCTCSCGYECCLKIR